MKVSIRNLIRLAAVLAALALDLLLAPQARSATFIPTGSLSGARAGHVAVLLPNGKIIVTGGYDGLETTTRLATAELYDPAQATWTATASLSVGRTRPTATLLPNGKVLIAAGHSGDASSTATCELYDAATERWRDTGSMIASRGWHTATLLLNGKVLVAGGKDRGAGYDLSSAEVYDPDLGTWTTTGPMTTVRDNHTATLLFNGNVLVTGGSTNGSRFYSLSSAELYDPTTGSWTATGSMALARQYHTATLLPDGRVLVIGGVVVDGDATSSAELYDPATGEWTRTGGMATARTDHTATLLPDGNVLATGGILSSVIPVIDLASAEVYDPTTGAWTMAGSLTTPRDGQTATLLPNGSVLLASGYHDTAFVWLNSAELYDSAPGPITLLNPVKLRGGAFQFVFSGPANGTYTVLTTTDPALPLVNWAVLGKAPEFAPGLYVFTAPGATNNSQQFFRVRSP